MNRTQKGAWYTLVMAILLAGFLVVWFLSMFGYIRESPLILLGWLLAILLYAATSVVLLRKKKKGPSGLNADEHDKVIRKNAVLVSFISVLVLSVIASIIPMIIYSTAVLMQYQRPIKGERS